MDLESVIASEVSQKEKNKYCVLMRVYGTQENGTDKLVSEAGTPSKEANGDDLDIGPTHECERSGLEQREEDTLKNVARGP